PAGTVFFRIVDPGLEAGLKHAAHHVRRAKSAIGGPLETLRLVQFGEFFGDTGKRRSQEENKTPHPCQCRRSARYNSKNESTTTYVDRGRVAPGRTGPKSGCDRRGRDGTNATARLVRKRFARRAPSMGLGEDKNHLRCGGRRASHSRRDRLSRA